MYWEKSENKIKAEDHKKFKLLCLQTCILKNRKRIRRDKARRDTQGEGIREMLKNNAVMPKGSRKTLKQRQCQFQTFKLTTRHTGKDIHLFF